MLLRGILSNKRSVTGRAARLFAVALSLAFAANLVTVQASRAMEDYDTEAVQALEEIALFGYGDRDGGGRGGFYGGGGGGGDGYGGGGYFNFLAPVTYAFKAVGYALKIPLYALHTAVQIIKVPLSFLHHRDGYES